MLHPLFTAEQATDIICTGDIAIDIAVNEGNGHCIRCRFTDIAATDQATDPFAACDQITAKVTVAYHAQAHALSLGTGKPTHTGSTIHVGFTVAVVDLPIEHWTYKGANGILFMRISDRNALLDNAVINRYGIRTGAAPLHETGAARRRTFQQTNILNGNTIRYAGPIVAVRAIVRKHLVDQAVAVDSLAINVKVLNNGIADIVEQRLSTFCNSYFVSGTIENS